MNGWKTVCKNRNELMAFEKMIRSEYSLKTVFSTVATKDWYFDCKYPITVDVKIGETVCIFEVK